MSTVLIRSLRPTMVIWIFLSMLSLVISAEPTASMKVSKRLRKSLEAQGYACIDLNRLQSGYLTTTVTVDHIDLVLIVDTGAPDTHFDPTRTKALGFQWSRDNHAISAKAGGSTETCEVRQLILGKVTAGPF
jgi:predicted aspartyl protease